MKKTLILFGLLFTGHSIFAQSDIPSAEIQIKTAVLAAPVDKRDKSTVLGYNGNGKLVELRKGSNEMICIADDPKLPGLSVASYHMDLEPFMQRGRDLRFSGKTAKESIDIRDEEVKKGKLRMPKQPTTLYVYTAKPENFDVRTGEVKNGFLRYVIYIPYATAESTGLPTKPDVPGMPWLMDPGSPRAHIMITPPQN
ncbi:MAG: hypothetical protein WBJ10_12220 [Daejeonella sp.]|uniref:hypothetical protein n=1 Tax=Daejeonella sp. TaxID=2805397 RepID=UPI003C70F495